MRKNSVVKLAAWLEIIVGATLVVALNVASELLFATAPEGVAAPMGRFAGIALFALGVASLGSTKPGSGGTAALGLLVFNTGAAIFLAWVAVGTAFRGVLLWPAVVLHAVIAGALLWTSFRGTPERLP